MIGPIDKLPENIEAERMVLGAVLLDNGLAPQALYELSLDDFSAQSHRAVFASMRSLDKQKKGINPLSLIDELTLAGSLDKVGGPAAIGMLFDGVPLFSDVREYVRLIKEAGLKRKAIYLARWLANEATGLDTRTDDLIASLASKVEELQEARLVDDLISSQTAVDRTFATLEDRWQSGNVLIGLPTGLVDLDQTLLGLRGGKCYVIAAAPSLGKTTLALNLTYNAIIQASEKRVGLFISLEMDVEELTIKALSTATRIDSYRIETGTLSAAEKDTIRSAKPHMQRMPIEYVEGFSKITAASIAARVDKVRRKHGRLDFLVIDYLQLLDSDERHESENAKLTEISRTLKRIAKKHNIPVIILSQLNRDYAKGAKRDYQLSDLRGSGAIEQDADVILFLMPKDWGQEEDAPQRRLVVAKNRGGKRWVTIDLMFFGAQSRFESAAREMYGYADDRPVDPRPVPQPHINRRADEHESEQEAAIFQ